MNDNPSRPSLRYMIDSVRRLFTRETPTRYANLDQAAAQLRNGLNPNVLWSLNGRFERGYALVKQGAVTPHHDPVNPNRTRVYKVASANPYNPPYHYLVDLDAGTCECPDHWKGHFCKHRIAAHIYEIAFPAPVQSQLLAPPPNGNGNKPPGNGKDNNPKPVSSPSENGSEAVAAKDQVIWGVIRHQGEILGVEILEIGDTTATVRALPKIVDGKKLLPQFPFEGKHNATQVPKDDLFHVKIFQ